VFVIIYPSFCFVDENEATTSFLMQLSTWDKEELDEKLANRVQVSKRAVAKVIQAFDRLMQRNEKITMALKGDIEGGNCNEKFWCMHVTNILYSFLWHFRRCTKFR
jgi:transcription initiation factor IIE alpha subunit